VIDERRIFPLLRRHEVGRAQHRPGHRHLVIRRLGLGESKIRQLRQAVLREQDVRRLDVAVDDSQVVGLGETVAELAGELNRFLQRQGPVAAPVEEAAAVHVLHDQERAIGSAAVVVDLDDVGVVQGRDRLGLGQEAADGCLAAGGLAQDSLDRHLAVEAGVEGQKHLAHATAAERALGLVAGRKIDDLDVIDDRVNARGITAAHRPLIAEARVDRPPLSRPGKRCFVAEALVVALHSECFRSAFQSQRQRPYTHCMNKIDQNTGGSITLQ